MNLQNRNTFLALGIALTLVVGCAAPAASVTPALEPTTVPAFTNTPDPRADLPSYSEIVDTYPAGVELCKTEAALEGISANGTWFLNGDIQIKDNQMQVKCYGTKITVNVEGGDVIIDGVIYAKGALLTVDKDLNWIEVSSWE